MLGLKMMMLGEKMMMLSYVEGLSGCCTAASAETVTQNRNRNESPFDDEDKCENHGSVVAVSIHFQVSFIVCPLGVVSKNHHRSPDDNHKVTDQSRESKNVQATVFPRADLSISERAPLGERR